MIINMTGGGGGTGATLTVNSNGSGTVTVSNATLGKSYSKPIAAGGSAEFKGLATGTWTVTLSGNGQPATRTVIVTADYSVNISYFSATINITYPEGSTVTATDGESTFTAPDTSGTWTLIVPNAGSWVISSTNGTDTASETVEITTEGQVESVELTYALVIIPNIEEYPSSAWNTTNATVTANAASTTITFSKQTNAQCYATLEVDCTKYTIMEIVGTVRVASGSGSSSVTLSAGLLVSGSFVTGYRTSLGTGKSDIINNTYDISAISGEAIFRFYKQVASTSSVYDATYTIDKLEFR